MTVQPQRSTLARSVTEELRQAVLRGDVQPGEYLPSRKELAARYGVGISTIHEAIQALTALELVNSHPGKGTWIRKDALETLLQSTEFEGRVGELDAHLVYEARSVIEVGLAELAAQKALPEDIERIWAALAAMEMAADNTTAFVEADLDFHLAVAQAGQNSLLERFYHLSRKLLSRVTSDWVSQPGVKEESIRIQRVIAQSIEEHDHVRARQAALDHMTYIGELLEPS